LPDMLSAVLERTVRSVMLKTNELAADSLDDKHIRFDVRCVDNDTEEIIEVEMQVDREYRDGVHWKDYFGKRALYYGSRLYTSQKTKGTRYGLFKRVFQITFCDFIVFEGTQKLHHVFDTRNGDGLVLSDAITYVVIELPKVERLIGNPVDTISDIDKWSIFLKYANDESHREFINSVISSKEGLQMASEIVSRVVRSREETLRRLEEGQMDYESEMDFVRTLGERQGMEKGMDLMVSVFGMVLRGVPIDTIVSDLKVSREVVLRVKEQMKELNNA